MAKKPKTISLPCQVVAKEKGVKKFSTASEDMSDEDKAKAIEENVVEDEAEEAEKKCKKKKKKSKKNKAS